MEGGQSLGKGAGGHPCGQTPPPGGGGGTLREEREGGRGERRGNCESGFQELKMREPALGGRGQGELLQSEEREGAQPGARRALEGGSQPLALAQR